MPNGGSDCCGTCWFNTANAGEAGIPDQPRPSPYCEIRQFAIQRAFWTYCGNHPHRRPERDDTPIGPVWTDDGNGRRVLHPAPDSETIRQHLLTLAAAIEEAPTGEYPIGIFIDELVVWQLGEYGEVRAVPTLERIATFAVDPSQSAQAPSLARSNQRLVALAREALDKISAPGAAD